MNISITWEQDQDKHEEETRLAGVAIKKDIIKQSAPKQSLILHGILNIAPSAKGWDILRRTVECGAGCALQ